MDPVIVMTVLFHAFFIAFLAATCILKVITGYRSPLGAPEWVFWLIWSLAAAFWLYILLADFGLVPNPINWDELLGGDPGTEPGVPSVEIE